MKLKNIPCVLLCGGKSSRMGRDKCFLPFDEKNLIDYQFNKTSQIFKQVFISCKQDKFKGQFKELIFDDGDEFAPMLALYSILKSFEKSFVFILCVDMPFVSKASVEKMANFSDESSIIIAKTKQKTHFLCGFYHSSLAPLCLELLQKKIHKISTLFYQVGGKIVEFDEESEFANLNTVQDYELFKI